MGRDLFGVKFGAHLAAHLTPEWRSQYLQYEAIVAILYRAVDRAPSDSEFIRKRYFSRINERFFAYCNKELIKINIFFGEKLSESIRHFDELRRELNYFKKPLRNDQSDQLIIDFHQRRKKSKKIFHSNYSHLNDLKLAFSELYLLLILLQNYQILNHMSFKKILTKHDKLFHDNHGIEWLKTHVETSPFINNQQVSNLIDEVELLVTEHLENGNRKKAMQKLRVPPLTQIHKGIVTYRLGLLNGLFIILLIILFLIYILTSYSFKITKSKKSIDWQLAIILYGSSLILIIHLIFIGINIIGWSSYGINHVLIFELDPRSHITHEEILENASLLLLIWIISFIIFTLSEYYQFERHYQPIIFLCLILFLLINPFNLMHRSSRYWFCKELYRIFSAPFHQVTFADFWLADQLTSLELIFYDFEYLICYFTFDTQWIQKKLFDEQTILSNTPICYAPTNIIFQTILGCLPSWFRMAQCFRRYYDTRLKFPHLINAYKYSCGLLVSICLGLQRQFAWKYVNEISNPFFYIWILSQILNNGFKFAWDLKMDWGLFDQNSGDNWFLRDELIYSRRLYYYLLILINFFLRYFWIIRIYLYIQHRYIESIELIIFLFALLESFRRFLWNFFRLENEHLNNCGQFRAVRDISINPIRPLISTIENEQEF